MPASKKEASRSRSSAQACKFQSFNRLSFTNHQATLFNLVHSFRTHDARRLLTPRRRTISPRIADFTVDFTEPQVCNSISQSHVCLIRFSQSITSEHLRFSHVFKSIFTVLFTCILPVSISDFHMYLSRSSVILTCI